LARYAVEIGYQAATAHRWGAALYHGWLALCREPWALLQVIRQRVEFRSGNRGEPMPVADGASPIDVAIVQGVGSATLGGAERVALEVVHRTSPARYRFCAFVSGTGAFARAVHGLGGDMVTLPLLQSSARARRGVLQFGEFLIRNILAAPWLAYHVHTRGLRLIYTNSRGAHIAGTLAGRLTGRPVVMHVQDLFQRPGFYMTLARWGAYAVIVPSAAAREWMLRSRWSLAAAAKIRVIPSPVDCDRFPPDVSVTRVRDELGLGGRYPVVAAVGALEEWKGQGDLIRAVPRVLQTFPTACFLIVGAERREGEYLGELRRLAVELGVGHAVLLLGQRGDVPDILAASDIAVSPSWRDTFPGAVGEAMASGLPVVATQAGGSVDMVKEGVTGLLVEPCQPTQLAEALIELASDADRARAMGRAGREHIEALSSPQVFIEQMTAVFHEALEVKEGR